MYTAIAAGVQTDIALTMLSCMLEIEKLKMKMYMHGHAPVQRKGSNMLTYCI